MSRRVLVIGGGLSGIGAALAAARAGAEVTQLIAGQGMHHLFSGCIDVLAYPPEAAEPVDCPLEAVAELIKQNPEHPYAKVGLDGLRLALADFVADVSGQGLDYRGDGARQRQVLTVIGAVRHSALVPATMDVAPARIDAVCNINRFVNFSATLLSREISARTGKAIAALDFDDSAFRRDSLGIARLFDDAKFAAAFGSFLGKHAPGKIVAVPALLGRSGVSSTVPDIESAFGGRLIETPGQPPSLPGLRLFGALRRLTLDAGVRVVQGARAVWPLVEKSRLVGVAVQVGQTYREERADALVLATGHLVSGGVVGERSGLREVLFDLPIAGESGPPFFSRNFLMTGGHPALGTGVAVDDRLRPVEAGATKYDNLFACGDILAGFDPYSERSGGGVALATGGKAGKMAAGGVA